MSTCLCPGHHSALEIAYPGVPHACQFFSSDIPHGSHHAVNDDLGIFILGQVCYVLFSFIERHCKISLSYFPKIWNMDIDEKEVFMILYYPVNQTMQLEEAGNFFAPGC